MPQEHKKNQSHLCFLLKNSYSPPIKIMRLVSNQISPNLTFSDALFVLGQIFKSCDKHDPDFSAFFGTKNYFLTNAARSGLAEIIKVIKPPKNKKIGISAFTCGVVATPFLTAGYEICWIDTDEDGLISLEDLKKKVGKISTLVVPHIFGQRAPVDKIAEITRKNGIFFMTDCAHAFNTETKFCDAKVISFGREKVFSCVSGGAVVWKNDSPFAEEFGKIELPKSGRWWAFQHIFHPFIYSIALWFWNIFSIGKGMIWLSQKLHLLRMAVSEAEKNGREDFPITDLPCALKRLLHRQFQNAQKIQEHRKKVAEKWAEVLPRIFPGEEIIVPPNYFRVTLKTKKQKEVLEKAKKIKFDLQGWNGVPISPRGVHLEKFGYTPGDCPNAENFAQNHVTFPTNIRTTVQDVERFEKLW